MDINKKFGGAWWDTLFILIKDDDEDFIMDFIERLPCKICRDNFYHKIKVKRINFKCKKEEIWVRLWSLRCMMDEKYKNKNNEEYLKDYLKFLLLYIDI